MLAVHRRTGQTAYARGLGLDTVQVQFPELFVALDFRDDPIHPNRGIYLSNDFQVAGFWGDVRDLRVRPEARVYVPLHRYNRRWTLALRGTLGFLFPRNYGDTLDPETVEGQAARRARSQAPAVIRDQHKLLFRAFYSGGPTSNRGYAFRDVGPHGPIGFLVPTGANCSARGPDGGRPAHHLHSAARRPDALGGVVRGALSHHHFALGSDFCGRQRRHTGSG